MGTSCFPNHVSILFLLQTYRPIWSSNEIQQSHRSTRKQLLETGNLEQSDLIDLTVFQLS